MIPCQNGNPQSRTRSGIFCCALSSTLQSAVVAGFLLLTLFSAPVCAGTLTGLVVDEELGTPVPGVLVQAHPRPPSTSERRSHHSVSDSAGAFGMILPPGLWLLEAQIIGYQRSHLDIAITVSEETGTTATLRLRAQALMMDEITVRDRRLGAHEHSSVFVESIRMADQGTYDVDVSEILDSAVGVDVRRYGGLGSFSAISIRGSTAEQVQIYLDGVPLTRAVGGGVDLGTLPVRGIKSIEAIPSMSATAASPGSATSSPCTRASTDGATRPSWRRSGRLPPAAGLRTG